MRWTRSPGGQRRARAGLSDLGGGEAWSFFTPCYPCAYVMFDSLLNNKNKFFIPKESNVTLIGKVKKFTVKLDQFNTTSITNQTHWDAEIWDCEIVQ